MLESYRNVEVSKGTHVVEDLAHAFFNPLFLLQQQMEQMYVDGHSEYAYDLNKVFSLKQDLLSIIEYYTSMRHFGLTADDYNEFDIVINDTFDILNEYSPTGYYFGTLEGDEACFGFWPLPSNEECDV